MEFQRSIGGTTSQHTEGTPNAAPMSTKWNWGKSSALNDAAACGLVMGQWEVMVVGYVYIQQPLAVFLGHFCLNILNSIEMVTSKIAKISNLI